MDAIGFFNKTEARLLVTELTLESGVGHAYLPRPHIPSQNIIQKKPRVKMEVVSLDTKAGNWLSNRLRNNDGMRIEIQIDSNEKMVIKNAYVRHIRYVPSQKNIDAHATIVSEDFIQKSGKIGTKIWSVS